jgi:hypothetical protein
MEFLYPEIDNGRGHLASSIQRILSTQQQACFLKQKILLPETAAEELAEQQIDFVRSPRSKKHMEKGETATRQPTLASTGMVFPNSLIRQSPPPLHSLIFLEKLAQPATLSLCCLNCTVRTLLLGGRRRQIEWQVRSARILAAMEDSRGGGYKRGAGGGHRGGREPQARLVASRVRFLIRRLALFLHLSMFKHYTWVT